MKEAGKEKEEKDEKGKEYQERNRIRKDITNQEEKINDMKQRVCKKMINSLVIKKCSGKPNVKKKKNIRKKKKSIMISVEETTKIMSESNLR